MNLTPRQIDALEELINIGVGRAASVLNEMLNTRVRLQVPSIEVFSPLELKKQMEGLDSNKVSAVQLMFKGPFSGLALLVFPPESAAKIVAILTDEESNTTDLDSVGIGTLSEVGNILINGVMSSIGNVLKERIDYSIPTYTEDTIANLLTSNDPEPNATVLLARTTFTVEQHLIEGEIILFFEVGSFDALLACIDAINLDPGGQV